MSTMSNTDVPEIDLSVESNDSEASESFGDLLSDFERSHSRKATDGSRQIEATVVTVTADSMLLDIGYKSEGILPLTALPGGADSVKTGDKLRVTVKGRDAEGYYEVSLFKMAQPKDWTALERAFAEKSVIAGTVTAVIKGGLSVDVGVRAFMPASRSGAREAAEMEQLVGQEIRCRITKLDVTEEDVVVDRRSVMEEEAVSAKESRYAQLKEGDVVSGQVRSLATYGAFVDLGGLDGLLHVSDISWGRVNNPADVLTVGQTVEARVLKIDSAKGRISLGLKQLQAQPWDGVAERFKAGERVRGTITRLMDFGAFAELEPGIEGLIHVSEMSWIKRVKKPSDLVKTGDTVDVMILSVNPAEKRISLGLKQALGDPWADVLKKFPEGSVIEGPVTSLTKFGAFVQLTEGVEGMVHISEITAEKRLNHPQEMLKLGQTVQAQILAVDAEKRLIKLSMKQLIPTSVDEYIAEHKAGDVVTGRIVTLSGSVAQVELGEGIRATCKIAAAPAQSEETSEATTDLAQFSAMLKARWKSGGDASAATPEALQPGQIRSFRMVKLDAESKEIQLELA